MYFPCPSCTSLKLEPVELVVRVLAVTGIANFKPTALTSTSRPDVSLTRIERVCYDHMEVYVQKDMIEAGNTVRRRLNFLIRIL